MTTKNLRPVSVAALAVLLSLAGCGDDKPKVRTQTGTGTPSTEKTDGDKTAKTDGGETSGKKTSAEGWNHLRGRFVVKGNAPKPPELVISQDANYCNPFKEKGELRNESIVVSAKNELKNVIVYLREKTDRIHEDYKKTEKAEVVLDNHKCRFEPHVTLIRTTQTLRIKNSDPMGHNTKYDSFSQSFNEQVAPGTPGILKQLTKEERFPTPYGCNVHPWMKGFAVVRENPYMAASADDGSFEIKNLPAGQWEFACWHEVPGMLEAGPWKRGLAKLTIEAGKPTDLGDIEVPAEKLVAK